MAKYIVIQIVGAADGRPCEIAGSYVAEFDPDAHDGRGDLVVTRDPQSALLFENEGWAFEYWKTQSTVMPLRPDGKPNKPLTAYTVEFVKLEAD